MRSDSKALTYSDHIVPSVEKKKITDTDGSFKKKKKKRKETQKKRERKGGLFAFGVEVGIIPAVPRELQKSAAFWQRLIITTRLQVQLCRCLAAAL